MDMPRYAKPEIERRWLADPARMPDLAGRKHRRIEDLYLDGRLRLRTLVHSDTGLKEFKLGKKYEPTGPMGGPITTIYLTEAEHAQFAGLPGTRLVKRRYTFDGVCLDLFEGDLAGLILTEIEFDTPEAAQAVTPPPWAGREVTGEAFFTGAALSRATPAELRAELARRSS